jgi:hypothetical protein
MFKKINYNIYDKEILKDIKEISDMGGKRFNKFKKNVDVLAAGCSVTYGFGLPEGETWQFILSKKNNISCDTLGFPGGSIAHIVFNIFKYCKKYGSPKNIICLFPDLYRFEVFIDNENNMSKDGVSLTNVSTTIENNQDSFFKKPYNPSDVYSVNDIIYKNLIAIEMLESFCELNKINLIISTWHFDITWSKFSKHFKSFKMLPESISLFNHLNKQLSVELLNCHKNIDNKNNFYYANDANIEKKEYGHYGIHYHIHLADFFDQELRLINVKV